MGIRKGVLSQDRSPRRTERGSRRGVGGFISGFGASCSLGQEVRGNMGHEEAWALHPLSLRFWRQPKLQPLSHLAVSSDLIHTVSRVLGLVERTHGRKLRLIPFPLKMTFVTESPVCVSLLTSILFPMCSIFFSSLWHKPVSSPFSLRKQLLPPLQRAIFPKAHQLQADKNSAVWPWASVLLI